jgi:hypothetical protein
MVFVAVLVLLAPFVFVSNASNTYDHDPTGFSLKEQHNDIPCTTCHIGGDFKDTPVECNKCHARNINIDTGVLSATHTPVDLPCNACHTLWIYRVMRATPVALSERQKLTIVNLLNPVFFAMMDLKPPGCLKSTSKVAINVKTAI